MFNNKYLDKKCPGKMCTTSKNMCNRKKILNMLLVETVFFHPLHIKPVEYFILSFYLLRLITI